MKLLRPLIIFDEETHDKETATAKIVSLAVEKYYESLFDEPETHIWLMNPGVPIKPEATAVHGITDEMVKDCLKFSGYADVIWDTFKGCDLAGFNHCSFDVPILANEFERCGYKDFPADDVRFVDAMKIFHKKEPRTLTGAMKYYCNQILDDAHDASADVRATGDVLRAQLAKYPDLEQNVEFLHTFGFGGEMLDFAGKLKRNEAGEVCFAFGKSMNVPVLKDLGYANWMLKNDFPINTKKILLKVINKEIT